MKSTFRISLAVPFFVVACASNQGTHPHDMSAAAHEQAAAQEEQKAEQHAAQHDPEAKTEQPKCPPRGACWTSVENPTEEHKKQADEHRELASKHRAASKALVDAEAQACVGLSEADRDMSPFQHREDISNVAPLESERSGKRGTIKPIGATVTFRAVPGMTAEWLQRVVECHTARAAAMGHNVQEMSYCPLMLKGVKATVSSTGNGFAVAISSDDAATAKEILKRADALAPPSRVASPAATN